MLWLSKYYCSLLQSLTLACTINKQIKIIKKVSIITMPRFKVGTSIVNVRKVTTDLSCSITRNKLDLEKR